jgi:hypothetical protein
MFSEAGFSKTGFSEAGFSKTGFSEQRQRILTHIKTLIKLTRADET